MKKASLLLAVLLLATLAQAKPQFAEKTLLTYSNPTDTQPSGKILPTTALEVIKTQGDKALVKLTGWNHGEINYILYATYGERIISAAFSKKAQYEVTTLKTETAAEGDKPWTQITLTTWVENKHMVKAIEPLYAKANSLYQTNCGLCHATHPTNEFDANQWPSVIQGMAPRTALNKDDELLITQFAQKHSKK